MSGGEKKNHQHNTTMGKNYQPQHMPKVGVETILDRVLAGRFAATVSGG